MAPTPFRRRKAAHTVRNLAIAEAALALAKHRATAATRRSSRRPSGKLLLLGGVAVAAGAAALLKRDKVAGLLPSRSESEPGAAWTPPQPSNYDAPGPVANTATPIPAPDPHGQPAPIDEAQEEAAAAAEAAAIGGDRRRSTPATEPGEHADEAHRPLAEAGEGESEGEEQADADLEENATYRDAGESGAQAQIEEAIEDAAQPTAGETPEPLVSEPDEELSGVPGGGISGRPFSGLEPGGDEPAPRPPASPRQRRPSRRRPRSPSPPRSRSPRRPPPRRPSPPHPSRSRSPRLPPPRSPTPMRPRSRPHPARVAATPARATTTRTTGAPGPAAPSSRDTGLRRGHGAGDRAPLSRRERLAAHAAGPAAR